MCAGCALLAMSGASGARAGMRVLRVRWLTPRRLHVATIAIFILAIVVSSVGLSGSDSRTSCEAFAASPQVLHDPAAANVARPAFSCNTNTAATTGLQAPEP